MADRSPNSHRPETSGKPVTRRPQTDNGKLAWHAVTIVTPGHACDAANSLKGHRFLSKEAPRLPLASCPSPEYCRCTYRHYADRRTGKRRASDRGELRTTPIGERRGNRGRRTTDREDD
ncbi:MAG TPA: hypothetical protein VJ764_00325 [Steroidobacteraceae bacterium]|nr:hypothetical protein [Steroidobacteraceae bacterium]